MRRRAASLAAACALAAAAWAATQTDPPRRVALPGSAAHGLALFETRGCAACHAGTMEQEAKDGLLRAGHPLEGVAHRGSWWSGRAVSGPGEAAEICLRSFIDPNAASFTPEERKALTLFLEDLGSERGVAPLAAAPTRDEAIDLASGDAGRGRDVWRRACQGCHPEVPGDAGALLDGVDPGQISRVIRQGKGTMPFFQPDRLTASQVADVVAYLETIRPRPEP